MDTVLPFGLRSSPKVFTAVADALEWCLLQAGVSSSQHYLDDFLTMGPADQGQYANNLHTIQEVCRQLGVPLKSEKIEGPSSCLTFLGIVLDAEKLELRLPAEKLAHIKELLSQWSQARRRKKRDLLVLIGHLAHACEVVSPGRIFLRHMIDTACRAKRLEHWIYLDTTFRSDLAWWRCFLDMWNGRSFMDVLAPCWNPSVVFSTDASGSWGAGAVWGRRCLQIPWAGALDAHSITVKEILPVVLAVALWGGHWQGCQVEVQSDNMAVVHVVNAQTSREPTIMHMRRCLHFFSAHYMFRLRAVHIAGINNTAADALSRNLWHVFIQVCPGAEPQPTHIPQSFSHPAAGLVITHLAQVARRYIEASIAPSTQRMYASAEAAYGAFCTRVGQSPFPASEQLLILFVADLSQ